MGTNSAEVVVLKEDPKLMEIVMEYVKQIRYDDYYQHDSYWASSILGAIEKRVRALYLERKREVDTGTNTKISLGDR